MHVLMFHPTPLAGRGSEQVLHSETAGLRSRGAQVSLLTRQLSGPEADRLAGDFDYVLYADAFFAQSRSISLRASARRHLRTELARLPRIDLVHVNLAPAAWAVTWLARLFPMVYYAHVPVCPNQVRILYDLRRPCDRDIGLGCFAPGYTRLGCGKPPAEPAWTPVNFASAYQKSIAVRHAMNRCRVVLAPSQWQLDRLAKDGVDRSLLRVLPPPVQAPRLDVRSRTDRTQGRYLLFVGRLISVKGPDHALQVLRGLPDDVRLKMAGDGPERRNLQILSRELGVDSRVDFLGQVDRATLSTVAAGAAAIILPSLLPETFNLAGAEAAAMGVPVIGYDVGGMRQWAQHYQHVCLTPCGDIPALLRSSLAALDRPRVGDRGPYPQPFAPSAHIDELLSVYADTCGISLSCTGKKNS